MLQSAAGAPVAMSIPLRDETNSKTNTDMCPSVPVLARKSAERDTFAHICLTNDFGDRTGMSKTVFRFYHATSQM